MSSYATTKEGLEKLKAELNELKSVRRLEIADRIAKAKEHGDLSENAEYHDAKDAMAFLEGRVSELTDFITKAVVTEPTSTEFVNIGCKVRCEAGGKAKEYHIVGPKESEPSAGKISNDSPLGIALLGRKQGETFEYVLPNGAKVAYRITGISC
ncbi:MAG TPA: transcription elongation factor GreA [Candidatus Baltobacteraceae bacterium]|nr:transcription elongation factor GreA [Candidatus Baltobacteraceae bacterium]